MGLIHVEIELINAGDKEYIRRGDMDPGEMRRITVRALVDSGALHMAINENIQEVLQLPVIGKEKTQLASGQIVEYDIVGNLEVRFGEYTAYCSAVVLPGAAEPLLGAIPMEAMNVIVHPSRQELVHSSKPVMMVGLRPAP
jgi:clan AA aspartic protease